MNTDFSGAFKCRCKKCGASANFNPKGFAKCHQCGTEHYLPIGSKTKGLHRNPNDYRRKKGKGLPT